ncbi:acyl-CoA dehydrogenase-like protein [Rhodococcus sp. SMB37]|nr:acyl-CoA dehydrogenase-like protein [Rhodococcus sp. SMB37]
MTASTTAARLGSCEEALRVAAQLADSFAAEAGQRDANRDLPRDEVRALAESGLLAAADPSIAQIPQSHFTFLEALRTQGSAEQCRFFYGKVLGGTLLANAQSERGPHPINVDTTVLRRRGDDYILSGRKFYSTGALFADVIVVRASLSDDSDTPDAGTPKVIAFVPRGTDGLTIVDDWDGMGQRTTASGTVVLDDIAVPASSVVPYSPLFSGPTTYGAQAQLVHAAIDVGIATGALVEATVQARRARPHFEADVRRAVEDPC